MNTLLAVERHPRVRSLVVLPELCRRHLDDPAARAGQIAARLGQPDPIHEGKTRTKRYLVPRVA